jgi:hypothetical protein
VILTVRSDYVNLCSAHPVLFALLKQDNVTFRLKQITAEGLAAIVREPLLMAGHKERGEQDALAAQIRRDISDRPGDLALIQMVLFETWKQHKANRSPTSARSTVLSRPFEPPSSGGDRDRGVPTPPRRERPRNHPHEIGGVGGGGSAPHPILDQFKEAVRACQSDIAKLCGQTAPGQGRS